MLRNIIILFLLCFSLLTFAQDNFTKVNGTILYSQYYPNPNAKFKGTIIFQNGAETSLKEWTKNKRFFRCIRQYGNVFLYDRSGLGKSPPDFNMSLANPMTAQFVNSKLIKLLKIRRIKPPYILVSHSYGGMYAGYFARKYPNQVVGMLMIDPVPSYYQWSNQFLKPFKTDIAKMNRIPVREAYQLYSFSESNRKNRMSAQLFYQLKGFHQTIKQINKLPAMSNKFPIIIVSSTYMNKNAPIKGSWYKSQQQWLNQNSNSFILQVASGHFIQLSHPKLMCEQLKDLVKIATKS